VPNGGIVDARVDAYELNSDGAVYGLGEVCPTCSYPFEGRCTWCPEDPAAARDIPECHRCHGREKELEPFYKRSEVLMPALISAAVTIVGTVASTLVLQKLSQRRRRR